MYNGKHRGRVIFDPCDFVKVIMGCINYNLILLLKASRSDFCSGCSMKDLTDRIEQGKLVGLEVIGDSQDGAAHDSS